MAHLMPLLLTISCSSKSRLFYIPGFTFLVLAHPGIPTKMGVVVTGDMFNQLIKFFNTPVN